MFGAKEILLIVILLVILFGSSKIPGVMKNLASGINVFKKELKKDEKPAKKSGDKSVKKSDQVKKSVATKRKKK
ncbi:MAG: twin-arginine translocase TatA/TatE family subunit [Alphaproteobacteria bacterium]|nr:twin-arginine translocase TatA/TatE family subunit [Alphaproteobacteria bacterium]